MGGSHETPFKMKGSGHYGLGNSSPLKDHKEDASGNVITHKKTELTKKQKDAQILKIANQQKENAKKRLIRTAESQGLSGQAAIDAANAEYKRNI